MTPPKIVGLPDRLTAVRLTMMPASLAILVNILAIGSVPRISALSACKIRVLAADRTEAMVCRLISEGGFKPAGRANSEWAVATCLQGAPVRFKTRLRRKGMRPAEGKQ